MWIPHSPDRWQAFQESFDGRTATSVRDPWSRFKSTYIREFFLTGLDVSARRSRGSRRTSVTASDWAQAPSQRAPKRRTRFEGNLSAYTIEVYSSDHNPHLTSFGCFNVANFYVRILNGLGGCRHHHHGHDDQATPHDELGPEHLAEAKRVLGSFDQLFVLEHLSEVQAGGIGAAETNQAAAEPGISERRKTFVGVFGPDTQVAAKSNNPFSRNGNPWEVEQCKLHLGDSCVEPATAHFKPRQAANANLAIVIV